MEMPELWKAWKAKNRLPTLSTSPLEISPKDGEIPTFPQLRRRRRMEKWKTKSRFPNFPPPRFLSHKNKTAPRAGFALRPPRRLAPTQWSPFAPPQWETFTPPLTRRDQSEELAEATLNFPIWRFTRFG